MFPTCLLSCVRLLVTPRTVARQAPLSKEEYWSWLPFPPPGESSGPRDQTYVSYRQVDSLPLSHLGGPQYSYMHYSLRRVWSFVTSWTGSSVHGISQARILEWVPIPFSKGSSWPRNQTQVSHSAGRCIASEPPRKPRYIMAPKEIILLKTCKLSPIRYLTSRTQLTFLLPLTAPIAEEGFGSLVIIPQVSPLTLTPPRSRHWFLRTESLLSLSCAPSATEHITLHYDFVHPCLFPPRACEFPGTYVLFISVSSTHPMANIEWYRISISNISDECMSKWIRWNGQPFP